MRRQDAQRDYSAASASLAALNESANQYELERAYYDQLKKEAAFFEGIYKAQWEYLAMPDVYRLRYYNISGFFGMLSLLAIVNALFLPVWREICGVE